MKSYIIRPLCLCIALLGTCSCDEWEYKVQYHDISIGGIESIWDVSSDTFYGMSLSQDWAVYHGDNARQVVYFGKNGKGIVYRIRVDETIDSTLFDYNSEDGCHVNIVCNGSQQKWTFARETPNNNQSDHCIMYTDSTKNGINTCYWRRFREVVTDTSLPGVLRDKLRVPQERIWRDKNIAGSYMYSSYHMNISGDFAEFGSDGRFVLNQWGLEKKGTYEVKPGVVDSLKLRYDDGTESAYPMVIDYEGFTIYGDYDEEEQWRARTSFWNRNWKCHYDDM